MKKGWKKLRELDKILGKRVPGRRLAVSRCSAGHFNRKTASMLGCSEYWKMASRKQETEWL